MSDVAYLRIAAQPLTFSQALQRSLYSDFKNARYSLIGALVIAGLLLANHPHGPGEALHLAANEGKFSLGSFGLDLTQSTFWVVFLYGVFINLNNFGIDQSFVQRYHAARDEKAAARSVWTGALLYVPVAALFFLIGSLLFSFYHASPELLEPLVAQYPDCLLYTSPSPRDATLSRMPSSA